jgi:replicative DNA helicase|tara:strand:+ start:4832 stop:6346 length:1515 start_codon:yes stop_codon:yes gene_type:complete
MVYSYELEQHLLAGLIKFPESYPSIAPFISDKDFFSENTLVNKTIFCVLRQALESGESLDDVILSQRVTALGISFEDNINIGDYIKALSMRQISSEGVIKTAQELKKLTIRREIHDSSIDVAKKMKSMSPNSSYHEIVSEADSIYNKQINLYEIGGEIPENLFEEMEEFIEDRGNNPVDEFGLMGPHERVNDNYGSLLRPGNISVVVARAGVGKTQFCMDFCTKVSEKNNNIPVLHFDNGEMSKEELIIRQCSALSGVPMHLLETGRWRQAGEDVVEKVRSTWNKVKNFKFYYYNVAGHTVESMANIIRRFYFSEVGRGNPLIFSFDYIKTTYETQKGLSSWEVVGRMVDKFKQLIQKELCFENGPCVAMLTSVQSNRLGITNNRNSESIVDDESIVSLSDQITQFCSHLFLLRQKTMDEIQSEPPDFGTHKLICLKYRWLGKDVHRATQPVEMPDGSKRKNYINLHMENFNITEKGDLQDMVDHMDFEGVSPDQDGIDLVPEI